MCLLDTVTAWDDTRVVCRTARHRAMDNPLRAQDGLGAACGIEFAAQAMAVHGALIAERDQACGSAVPRIGYLVSVRSVKLHVQRLDTVAADLTVTAERLLGDTNHILYRFSIAAGAQSLLEGQAAVVLDATALRAGMAPAHTSGVSE